MTVDNFRFVHQAIKLINPIAEYVIRDSSDSPNIDNDTCTIEWHKGDAISKSDIKTKVDELQVEYDAQDYARQREAAYPSTKDFMEAYTEKEIGGNTGKWDAYVINYNKTRSDNPK